MSANEKQTTCILMVGFALLVVGCRPAAKEEGAGDKAPIPVTFASAVQHEVADFREFTGRTAAVESVEVRARVSGYLRQRPRRTGEPADANFKSPDDDFLVTAREGERVTIDTPLFEIDPEPYQLALDQATGNLSAAEAQLVRLEKEMERIGTLRESNSVSDTDFDLAEANLKEAASRKMNLITIIERAELDLEFTKVRSRIGGIVGRSALTQGNLVTADTTPLTTIVSTDPIHVYFDVDESSFLEYRQMVTPGRLDSADDDALAVDMALARDTEFPYHGHVDFLNNITNPETGNTTLRAVFANPSGALSPGLFARVRVPFTKPYMAILVPTRALAMDQEGRYVMLVDSEYKVQRRLVRIGTSHGDWTVISDGLSADDQVIVSGLQKVKPGDIVDPKPMADSPPLPILRDSKPAEEASIIDVNLDSK